MDWKPNYTPLTPEQAKQVMAQWKRAAPLLEEQRERDIRATDTERDITVFDDVLEDALIRFPPQPESGLVEMQRYFRRFAERQAAAAKGATDEKDT